ncbi:MAG TPA: PilZ domain-containing protein [Sphingomonas sp.]
MLIEATAPADKAPDVPPAERREGGKRHQSVLLIGRVVGAGAAPTCLVHDISKAGMMARFAAPPAVGSELTIEIRGLPPVTGTVRWVRGHKAGLQFEEAQDLQQVFHLRRPDGTIARAPRFPLSAPAQLRLNGRRLAGELLDVSAGGAKIALVDESSVAPGQTGAIHLTMIPDALFGTVCWVREGRAGFRFAAPLPLATLTQILASG